MAFLNPLWGKLTSAGSQITGPSYDYVKNIQSPGNLGVGSDGNFGQMATNMRAGFKYVDYLIEGPALGNSYFLNTGGTCINKHGEYVSRYNYVNNMPSRNAVFGEGLVSGVLDDVGSMNPMYLLKGLTADATPACDLYKCDVTDTTNGDTQYLSPGMSPDFAKGNCRAVDPPDPGAQLAKIKALQQQQAEISQQLSKDPNNGDLRATYLTIQDQLDELTRSGPSEERARSRREAFTQEGGSLGIFLALGGLAVLVFSLRSK